MIDEARIIRRLEPTVIADPPAMGESSSRPLLLNQLVDRRAVFPHDSPLRDVLHGEQASPMDPGILNSRLNSQHAPLV